MIKFFRKIRQQLLTENKFSKYLLYAIGEIILVVAGILIALQVNDWNEQKKINLQEKVFLSGLINDLSGDISYFKLLKNLDSLNFLANRVLLNAFKHDSIRENKEFLKKNVYDAIGTAPFYPERITFNQLESTGKVNYISSDSIRRDIQYYYNDMIGRMRNINHNQRIDGELIILTLQYLDYNSSLQQILPEHAKLELDEFDNSFFYEPIESPRVKEFSSIIASRQLIRYSYNVTYSRGIINATRLKQNLIEYLDTK